MTERNAGPARHGGTLALAAARANGASAMFTLSGGHVFPLYDAATHADPPMRLVDVRHEQSAVFAAEATARLALPRTVLRYAGGRELTLGDLGTEAGLLGGINAIIVGNYLTTLGRPAGADLDMLSRLKMPIKALSATL